MSQREPPPDLKQTAIDAGGSLLLSVMRSKLRFIAFICAVFIAGLIYSEGFSGTTIVMIVITIFVVGSFSIIVWFWTALLSSIMTNRKR